MVLIVTNLPTSRKKSSTDTCSVQLRLSTSRAAVGPSSKLRNRRSWAPIASRLASSTSVSRNWRSSLRPEGSPIIPVAPPTSAIGAWPASWKRRSSMIDCRLPMCSESAVGSKPQ
jgi:hypothetical protein